MVVSIIVPTYNSAKTLEKCLKSIKNQTYRDIEIIIVDRFSNDETIKIAKRYGCKIIQYNCERARAKNIGLRYTNPKSKYVMFVDSDMELTHKVIEECVNVISKNKKIGGVIIPEKSVGNSFWVKVRDFERSFYAGTEIESARFFRKDLVLKVDGFDEEVVFFEESTLPQKIERLGYNVKARIESVILHHENDFSLLKWLKKKYYYGMSALDYKKKYKEKSIKQTSVIYRYTLFFNNKKFYTKPDLAIGVIILKNLELLAVVLGCLVKKLKLSV